MYAIIKTGGKQYRISKDQTLKVEKLAKEVGQLVKFNDILMIALDGKFHIDKPSVKEAVVTAEVIEQGRYPKIEIIKFKRRKHHMKRLIHRQSFTTVKIKEIILDTIKKEEMRTTDGT